MMKPWRWAGACSIGTSHIKSGTECQDRASCLVHEVRGCEFLSAVVSDGAGSASEAANGAAIICTGFQRQVAGHLRGGEALEGIDTETVAGWLDEVRERIIMRSAGMGLRPRDFAATLVAAIVGPECAIVAHVGDGAAVLRDAHSGDWLVPSWPFHGEYASTTRFVVDDPQPVISFAYIKGQFDRAVVFSDGIENLVLDHRAKSAPRPFFDRLTNPVAAAATQGRDRRLSKHLRSYLDGEQLREATDDDKSLIIGVRA